MAGKAYGTHAPLLEAQRAPAPAVSAATGKLQFTNAQTAYFAVPVGAMPLMPEPGAAAGLTAAASRGGGRRARFGGKHPVASSSAVGAAAAPSAPEWLVPPRPVASMAACVADGVADGWFFAATPYDGLWAWHSETNTSIELIREAHAPVPSTAPETAAPAVPPHERRGHRPEVRRGGAAATVAAPAPAPRAVWPLHVPATDAARRTRAKASASANTIAVVPAPSTAAAVPSGAAASGSVNAAAQQQQGIALISVVGARLHAISLRMDKPAAAGATGAPPALGELIRHGPLDIISAAADGAAPVTNLAAAALGDESAAIDALIVRPVVGARPSAKRVSLLVYVRGKKGAGTAVAVATLDVARWTLTLATPWLRPPSRKQEFLDAQWLGDCDHSVVVQVGRCELQIFRLRATDRSASACATGTLEPASDVTAVSSPGAPIVCFCAATFTSAVATDAVLQQRSAVVVATSDNAVQRFQVLRFGAGNTASFDFSPVAGFAFQPAKEHFVSAAFADEESIVAVTDSGRAALLSSAGSAIDIAGIERPPVNAIIAAAASTSAAFVATGRAARGGFVVVLGANAAAASTR